MFENVGGKIKSLAEILLIFGMVLIVLGSAIYVFWSVAFQYADVLESLLLGLLFSIVGCFCCWILMLLMYGFGQLVENSDKNIFLTKKLLDLDEDAFEDSCKDL